MPLTAVALIVLITTCSVRGQVNLLSTEYKPPLPVPQPTQQTAASNTLKLPFNAPPLLPPASNRLPSGPANNQQILPSKFSPQFNPQFNQQFPPQLPPTLPPQLQSQLPIQLPQHLQQQISFQLQPPFPVQTPPPFPPHIPPFLQNTIQSALLPPQFPQNLPTKFPPPPPSKPKHQLSPPNSINPPFPTLSVHPGTRNVSLQANRAPRTLQMIGSSNGQTFHKISDNLRPGGNTWYYKKNTFPKRPPHPQAPKPIASTPPPNPHATRLIPLNQFNQLDQITKLNQLNQPQIQTSLNQWSLLNNQHLNALNTIGSSWADATNFNHGPQLPNFNSHPVTPLKSYDHTLANLNSFKTANNLNLNNHGFNPLNSSPNLNSAKGLNNPNLNNNGFNNLNSSPDFNSFKNFNNVINNDFKGLSPSSNVNNFKAPQNLNSYDTSLSSPYLNSFNSFNSQNINNHGHYSSTGFENLNLQPPPIPSNVQSNANQNLNNHGTSLNSNLNTSPKLNSLKNTNSYNSQPYASSSGYGNLSLLPSVSSNQNSNSNSNNNNNNNNNYNTNNSNNNISNNNKVKSISNNNSNVKSITNYNGNNLDKLNSTPSSSNLKSSNAAAVSYLHINVHSDSTLPKGPTPAPPASQYNSPNQSPFTSNHNQKTPFTSHQQSSSFYPNAPITPQDVFKDTALQIAAITIPEPEKPQFDTLRSQVSALKAKHKDFFSDHQNGDPPPHSTVQSSYQPSLAKPAFGAPKPTFGPPPAQQASPSLNGINPWTPMEQNKLTPPKWNPHKFEFQQGTTSFVQDHDQYNSPKKTLPLKNDFVGFPPAKGSIKNELNFISNWEKGIGIIHKNDHGNAEKGQTIISAGDTDDFKKMDKQESSKVEVFSVDQMHRRPTGRNETTKKPSTVPKKIFGKGKASNGKKGHTSEEHKSEEIVSITQEPPISNTNETQSTKAEVKQRRKRDLWGPGSTTESIVISPENVNTAAPISKPKTEQEANQQPQAEPLVAPATESDETSNEMRHVKALTLDKRVADVLDSSEETSLFLGLEDYDLPHAEALTKYDSAEGDILSDEDLDGANSAGLAYDDYDDAYLDDDHEEKTIQSRSDSFIFEEHDGTTSKPYAESVVSEKVGNISLAPQSEALVDPRSLHGRDLIYFLEEAIRNSSQFLPDEAEDRSFDVVDPPKDVIKFPYYDRTEPPINVDSALRFAENLTTFSKSLYESKNGNQCQEVDIEIPEEPAEPGADGFLPVRRLKRLGNKIDCLKNKHFGKEPLDNPLFKEEFVGAGRSSSSSSSNTPAPQPDPSVAVFSDVIRLIKQHLNEEQRSRAKEFNDVVTPRQLNLSDTKNPSPNNAVLEQLRLGKRRPLLPNKQPKKVEEPKVETSHNNTSETHGLKIVFPRRLNITKTYDEAKKSKPKFVDIEGYKAKLNHSRATDHESYKASLARKLNFDKLDKSKIPRSQRRDSDDGLTYEPLPRDHTGFMPVFDINSYYPKFIARADDDFPFPLTEKGFATKYDELEREADELISAVRKSSAEVDRRNVHSGKSRSENSKKLKDKPYGTSYSPSYQQYRLLSRKDDQKRTPTVDELVDFYSRRSKSNEHHELPSIPRASTILPIFDVSTFYPRIASRTSDDQFPKQSLIKRKDTKITLEDLEALQAPKITPKPDSSFNSETSKLTGSKKVRDDIADFYEGSQHQPAGSAASTSANDGHHTFKKSEPPNPDLPETDKATFHLDQPAVGSSHRSHRLHPVKVVPRKPYKTNAKSFKRPPLKYRRKKVYFR